MQFTQIPQQSAPLGGEARYTLTTPAAETIVFRIEGADGTLFGAKRFVAVTEASFDAAPYLRNAVRIVPSTGNTGFKPVAGRTVTTIVQARTQGGETLSAPAITVLPCAQAPQQAQCLTTLPRERLIAEGEGDELTLFNNTPCTVTVTAQAGDTVTGQRYISTRSGWQVFRLDTSEFPGAESITVDTGAGGVIAYTVLMPQSATCRLAWRTNAGSIEHYTFPVVVSGTLEAAKQRAYGVDGHTASATSVLRTRIRSAYETPAMLEAIAGIIPSPAVWMVDGDVYTPVDVLTEQAEVLRHGSLSCIDLEIRPKHKTRQPWN